MLTNKSYSTITNIPLAFHKGYANSGAMPASFESNLLATNTAVWACWPATFLGKTPKVDRTNKQQNSQLGSSFFWTVVLTRLNWPPLMKRTNAGISTVTTDCSSPWWQNKTQACTWVLTPTVKLLSKKTITQHSWGEHINATPAEAIFCQKNVNDEVNSETHKWRMHHNFKITLRDTVKETVPMSHYSVLHVQMC